MKLESGKPYLLSNGDIGTCYRCCGIYTICGLDFTKHGHPLHKRVRRTENFQLEPVCVVSEVDSLTFRKVPQKKPVKRGRVVFQAAGVHQASLSWERCTEKEWKSRHSSEADGFTFIRILEGVPEFPVEEVWEEV